MLSSSPCSIPVPLLASSSSKFIAGDPLVHVRAAHPIASNTNPVDAATATRNLMTAAAHVSFSVSHTSFTIG
eukprot:2442430-Rhodomonas_salina.2